MNEKQTKFGWSEFLIGLIFILFGSMAINRPIANLLAITLLFGLGGIVKGIFLISGYVGIKKGTAYHATYMLIMGIIDIIFGLILVFNLGIGAQVLPFIFATWFIINSIFRLFHAYQTKKIGTGYYWLTIIVNLIGVVLGVLLLMNPFSSALAISFLMSFYFYLFGFIYLMDAFIGKKSSK
ncbi:HdeD family acid-resistance protein [Isobaculum melis]|uniref:Uncharacterized membrane protein HdeD, DUF308 family n=1 Tax=Isobaculum melis TaxID=142588 RepID=A0A1H9RXE5_9LACT|nr:DUF308 domain-containing protein [Isobaculum melis]SER76793.1 Uncharacterized membrane protein HdeD, DUF308 family [Isobaculum melis]